jgi:hypothetical protein
MGDQSASPDPGTYSTPPLGAHLTNFSPTAPPPSPVPYQTALWALVPLAISTMTQPSGRVLASSPYYRTYLRSSPILCAIDALVFLLHVGLASLLFRRRRLPIAQAVDFTIRGRYRGAEEPGEGIQYLEKQTWLRWLWFIFGTAGPAIKLAVMQGVPWTKAWGMCFLGTFLVFECMVFLKKRAERVGYELLDQDEPPPTLVRVPERVIRYLKYMNRLEWSTLCNRNLDTLWNTGMGCARPLVVEDPKIPKRGR